MLVYLNGLNYFRELDNPLLHYEFLNSTDAIDHNGYTHKNNFYLASYATGLRVINISKIDLKHIEKKGFFDTYNEESPVSFLPPNVKNNIRFYDEDHDNPKKGGNAKFNGAWSVYPYFKSENIIISDINSGLFIVRK